VQKVGRELGVKYVLEGSARKIADQVRINVQLIEASTGEQVWGQRYDKQFHDIFKLQDEIVRSLIATLNVQLPLLEKGFVLPQRTNNLEAYDYYLRGFEYFLSLTPAGFAKARNIFEKSIDLDPVYADPYGTLSWIYLLSYIYQWDKDGSAIDRAADFINKSIALDDSDGDLYAVRAWIVADKGTRSDAIADGKRAVSLAPNSAFAWNMLAEIEINLGVGNPEEALADAQRAIRLNPRESENYLGNLCTGR
jgi:adenylate cyclase